MSVRGIDQPVRYACCQGVRALQYLVEVEQVERLSGLGGDGSSSATRYPNAVESRRGGTRCSLLSAGLCFPVAPRSSAVTQPGVSTKARCFAYDSKNQTLHDMQFLVETFYPFASLGEFSAFEEGMVSSHELLPWQCDACPHRAALRICLNLVQQVV